MFVVYSKHGCTWCDRAKALLAEHAANDEVAVKTCVDLAELRDLLGERGVDDVSRITTFPQIFRGDRYIGTHDQLADYLREPLLNPDLLGTRRFTPFPIVHNDMWAMYLQAVASFWTTDEVSLAQDVDDWKHKLTEDERYFVKHVLAFFAGSDGIVMENLQQNFGVEVQTPEARQFYAYQAYNESIHSWQYGALIDTLIDDSKERERLFWAIETLPAVKAKAAWATKWLHPGRRFAERLVAFVCVEGILFSGSFCAIFWLKQRSLMPGLGLSNQFISRDEGLHQDFGALLYRHHLRAKLSQERVEEIVREAVENEEEFIVEAIPCKLVGMNSDLMRRYIKFVADRLLLSLGHAPIYGCDNPFPWMELISLGGKDNFFERFSSEYQKAGVMASDDDRAFGIDADF